MDASRLIHVPIEDLAVEFNKLVKNGKNIEVGYKIVACMQILESGIDKLDSKIAGLESKMSGLESRLDLIIDTIMNSSD
jgi:hypothetical protein